jgi:hypothetical protein
MEMMAELLGGLEFESHFPADQYWTDEASKEYPFRYRNPIIIRG